MQASPGHWSRLLRAEIVVMSDGLNVPHMSIAYYIVGILFEIALSKIMLNTHNS